MLKDSRFQNTICVGPIGDQTYENLHHYMVAQDRVVCYQVAKLHTTMWQSPIKVAGLSRGCFDFITRGACKVVEHIGYYT